MRGRQHKLIQILGAPFSMLLAHTALYGHRAGFHPCGWNRARPCRAVLLLPAPDPLPPGLLRLPLGASPAADPHRASPTSSCTQHRQKWDIRIWYYFFWSGKRMYQLVLHPPPPSKDMTFRAAFPIQTCSCSKLEGVVVCAMPNGGSACPGRRRSRAPATGSSTTARVSGPWAASWCPTRATSSRPGFCVFFGDDVNWGV